MPDEQNTLNPNQASTPASDAATLVMADPQKLVDEALTTPSMTPPPVTPTDDPALLDTPQPDATPLPDTTTSEPSPIAAEEMPLAFASMTPSPAVDAIPAPTPTSPSSTPDMGSVPPLGNLPPITPTQPVEPPKKKGGKLVAVLIGFFLLLGGIGGGYYYYTNYLVQKPQVAAVSQAQCHGCSAAHDGGWLVWRNGSCHQTGICNSSQTGKDTNDPTIENAGNSADCSSANGTWCESNDSTGKHYAFCISNSSTKGCNNEAVDRGYTITYGANADLTTNGQCPSGFFKKCTCGPATICFDKDGVCNQKDASVPNSGLVGTDYNQVGLCAIAGTYNGSKDPNAAFEINPDYFQNKYNCTDNGCSSQSSTCVAIRYTCTSTVANNSCTKTSSAYVANSEKTGTSLSFEGKCGTVEQIDISCGGVYVTSRTRKNGDCQKETVTPSTTTTVSPTFKCDSLAKDKATPKIGDTVAFTCAGSSTPANSVTLTYQFRYRKDAGAWTSLTATANKASFKVDSAGDYDVQCKACGKVTATAASTCDPDWSAAQ